MAQVTPSRHWRAHLTAYVDDDVAWLALSIAAAGAVSLVYLATHVHPAYEGGLFLDIVTEIQAHGYGLPERIHGYTAEGVPFAYPPLMFYVIAFALEVTRVDPVTLLLVVPSTVVVLTVVPFYYTAKELLGVPRQAGLATVVFAVTPAVLRWHLSAGGIVRAPAMLLAVTGAYVSIRLFRDRDRRWLGPAIALFGLTVLTHPHYTAFFGLTYIVFYVAYDRTIRGLLGGALVAAGGLALAAPWWIQVALTHGPDVFLAASGSHSGLLGGVGRLERQFIRPVREADPLTMFYLSAYAGGIYAVIRRRYLLPAWMILASYVIGKNRFLFVAGAMLIGLLTWEVLVPAGRWLVAATRSRDGPAIATSKHRSGLEIGAGRQRGQIAALAIVVAVVVGAVGIGGLFAGSVLDTAHHHSTSLPQTVDGDDREAMTWVKVNTPPGSDVLVLGDAAEWYPYYTGRTIVVSPWGYEWTSSEQYYEEVDLYRDLSACDDSTCLNEQLAQSNRDPEYVAIPVGEYTVRGKEHWNDAQDVAAIASANEYRLVHENGGVAVFRVTSDPSSWEPPDSVDELGTTERPVAALD